MLALGLTQAELASKSGISVATLRKLQHGRESTYGALTLHRIAGALAWDPEELTRRLRSEPPERPLEKAAPPDDGLTSQGDLALLTGAWAELSAAERHELLRFADYLRSKQTP
jgi:transcriptional regulator with XRE-family HTH domain